MATKKSIDAEVIADVKTEKVKAAETNTDANTESVEAPAKAESVEETVKSEEKPAPKKRGRKPKTETATIKNTTMTAKKTAVDKKTATKKTTKPAVKKTASKTTKKKTPVKTTTDVLVSTKIQFEGAEFDTAIITEAIKLDYASKSSDAIKTLNIYIKPEDKTAYYVVNDSFSDKIDL